MDNSSVSYEQVEAFFGEEVISDRYKYIYDKMLVYLRERLLDSEIMINPSVLQQAVMDFFVDMYRLMEFHKIKDPNNQKRVAYEVYWLLRRKALQERNEKKSKYQNVFVNEGFLTIYIAHELLKPDTMAPMGDREEFFLNFLKHIHYHLKYRSVDKQSLELMLDAFETGKAVS